MNNKERLEKEIASALDLMGGMDINSEEYEKAAKHVGALMDRSIEFEKLGVEQEQKQKQMKEERIDRIVKNILTGVSVVGGFILTVWGTNKTLRFEETGTITTTSGRKFASKLFSWLK